MIDKGDLIIRWGKGLTEYLYYCVITQYGTRYEMVGYLGHATVEECLDDPDLYLRFTDSKNGFSIQKLVRITEENIKEYENMELGQLYW